MVAEPTIFLVDDDPAVRRALAGAGQLLGLPIASFATAEEFLQVYDRSRPGCLVLDLKMPGMSGLELQQALTEAGIDLPVIMISGHADVRIAVEAMSRGAVTLLEKPFLLDELLDQIRKALELDAARRAARIRPVEGEGPRERLTPKEREVFERIVAGKTNKQIAAELQLSIRAVEDRRARLLKKLHVRSLAELVPLPAPSEPHA